MGTTFLITKLTRHPVVFVETGETRLMVLVLEAFPAELLLEGILSVLLDIGHQVQRLDHFHAQDTLVKNLVNEDIGQWEALELTSTEAPVDILEQGLVDTRIAAPLFGFTAAFGRVVGASQHILDPVLPGKLVQAGEECSILRQILVGDLRAQEGRLQILHFFPIDHFGIEMKTKTIHQLLDVAHCLVRVPACIDVEQQGPQAHFLLGDISRVGTV
ncbi:hypothetical protein D9M71_584180 [compost metagenome]